MIATLNSYESMFGPYHLQTLALAVHVGLALRPAGESHAAQMLLEHAAKHLVRYGDQANSLRLAALTGLRDLFVDSNDTEKVVAVQKEIVRSLALGQDDSTEERADLIRMLLSTEQASASA